MKNKNVNHIRWGVILSYVVLFLNIIISLAYTPVMLRLLGPGEHGLYSTVSTAMSWLSLLSLGVGSSYIRFYSKYKVNHQEDNIARLNGLFLSFYIVVGLVALVCGYFISQNLHFVFADGITKAEYQTAKILTRIITVDMAIGFPSSLFSAIIRANEKFIHVKIINLFQCFTTPLLTLPLLLMGYGSVALVAVTTLVDILAYSYYVLYCIVKLNARFKIGGFEKGLIRSIVSFSVFVALNSLISMVNNSVDKIILARVTGTVGVSVYTIGSSLFSYYSSFSSAITGNLIPRINLIVNKNAQNVQKLRIELTEQFTKVGRIQFYIQMLMCTGIIFFGQPFLRFWAGPGYHNSYYVAVILCLAYTVPLIQSMGTEIQRAQNKHRFRTIVYVLMTALNVVLTVILCRWYGEIGAVIGTAIATIAVDGIVMNIFYHKKLHIDVIAFWKNIFSASKGLIIPLLFGTVISYFLSMDTILKLAFYIFVYSAVYCCSIWLFSMSSEEKNMIFVKLKKRSIR